MVHLEHKKIRFPENVAQRFGRQSVSCSIYCTAIMFFHLRWLFLEYWRPWHQRISICSMCPVWLNFRRHAFTTLVIHLCNKKLITHSLLHVKIVKVQR